MKTIKYSLIVTSMISYIQISNFFKTPSKHKGFQDSSWVMKIGNKVKETENHCDLCLKFLFNFYYTVVFRMLSA